MTSYVQLHDTRKHERAINIGNGVISSAQIQSNGHISSTPAKPFPSTPSTPPSLSRHNSSGTIPPPRPPNPEETTNLLSYLLYLWLTPLIDLGAKRTLEEDDLYEVRTDYAAKIASADFQREWQAEVQRAASSGHPSSASLIRVFRRIYGRTYAWAFLAKVLCDMLAFVQPVLLKVLLSSLLTRSLDYLLTICATMFFCGVVATISGALHWRTTMMTGLQVRNCLITAVYRKALRLSPKSRQERSTGMIVNLMSTDASKIDGVIGWAQTIPACLIQIVVAVALLVNTIGVSSLAGVAVIVFLIPVQGKIVTILQGIRKKAVVWTDKRVKLTNEILQGIKVIKVYAWESSFLQRLTRIRLDEMGLVRKGIYIRAGNVTIAQFGPILMSLIAFVVLALLNGNDLTPSNVFSALVLFNLLRFPLMQIPFVSSMLADSIVSVKRIQGFLLCEEIVDTAEKVSNTAFALQVEHAEYSWETVKQDADDEEKGGKKGDMKMLEKEKKKKEKQKKKEQIGHKQRLLGSGAVDSAAAETICSPPSSPVPSALRDATLTVSPGSLTAIVGSVGSGKSSLLSAVLGEMKRKHGRVQINGTVSYCHQTAWIQNTSLRENILFGLPYDAARYNEVIQVCELTRDLAILPAGDMTEIGEKGITLSGGQKQRVNLARAVYFNADILLLDDIFSALDMHVGQSIFRQCILGTLKDKTRLLVTHQLQYCQYADYIVFMKNGTIVEQGTFQQLLNDNKEFATLINSYGGGENAQNEDEQTMIAEAAGKKHKPVEKGNSEAAKALAKKQKKAAALMSIEERATGTISWSVYKYYAKALGGSPGLALLFVILCVGTGAKTMTDVWLAWWSDTGDQDDPTFYMMIYALLGAAQCVLVFILAFLVARFSTAGAIRLHDQSFRSVIRAPLSFTETTPLGRIIHRFSKDQDTIDTTLAESVRSVVMLGAQIIGSVILMIVATPFIAVPLLPCVYLYYRIQGKFRQSSREIKRLDSTTRSPLFAHFSETLTGLSTIRAYHRQAHFIQGNEERVDRNVRAYYLTIVMQRWLGMRLESIGASIIFFSGATIVLTTMYIGLDPGLAGLSLSYAISMTTSLLFMIRQSIEAEMAMNSVERSKYYAEEIAQEKPAVLPRDQQLITPKPPTNTAWPSLGSITFEHVSMRYRPNLPLVLNDINLQIRGGERIGIVGRTGAGKSSLMTALFRLVELHSGRILIDGVSIADVGLATLRHRLAIIPQDAVLFSGTIRSNLSPFSESTDAQLWAVLDRAHLKSKVASMELKLDSLVNEGGENFSQGERCQLCLARAMLKQTTILVMDEATASIDLETDTLIQRSLREEFHHCTILTIAHRLLTVIDYDRILVLEAGNVVEFDAPNVLLQKQGGAFRALVEETGESNEQLLRDLAEKQWNRQQQPQQQQQPQAMKQTQQ